MNSFWKSFVSIFNLFPGSKTYCEQKDELDNQMQDLYDRMGWGRYNNPCTMSPLTPTNNSWNTAADINRVLEAEQSLMNEIYGYNFRKIVTKEFHKPLVKDPARPSINKYL